MFFCVYLASYPDIPRTLGTEMIEIVVNGIVVVVQVGFKESQSPDSGVDTVQSKQQQIFITKTTDALVAAKPPPRVF